MRLAGSGSHYRFRTLAISNGEAIVVMLDPKGEPTQHRWTPPAALVPPPGVEFALPSVTTILDAVIAKPRLMHWYYKTGIQGIADLIQRYGRQLPADAESLLSLLKTEKLSPYSRRDAAGAKGTDVHGDLEVLADGRWPKITPENEGLREWWAHRGLHPTDIIASEIPVASFVLGYAGTLDLIYKDPTTGFITLTDLKTSRFVGWTAMAQVLAYKLANAEAGGIVDRVSVLHVRPRNDTLGNRVWVEQSDENITEAQWRAVLNIYRTLPVDWVPDDVE